MTRREQLDKIDRIQQLAALLVSTQHNQYVFDELHKLTDGWLDEIMERRRESYNPLDMVA